MDDDNMEPYIHPAVRLKTFELANETGEWYTSKHAGGMVINFGKYRGKTISEIPLSYLYWAFREFGRGNDLRPHQVCT